MQAKIETGNGWYRTEEKNPELSGEYLVQRRGRSNMITKDRLTYKFGKWYSHNHAETDTVLAWFDEDWESREMDAADAGAGIAGKTVKTWVVSSNRQPEKPGVYKVYNRRNGKTTETEMVWNGTYWMTTNGGKVVDVVQWLEEAPVAGASADGTALASADAGEHAELIGSVDAQRARMMYEARIQLYKEQIGTGYIGIGRTLNEAKASGTIPHGEWAEWVTRTTGLEIRQAQRCMQAATEIKDGSALARLEMSKALLLLSSGLDEEAREQVAEKAAEEGATVKGLKEEIRRLKLEKVQSAGAVAEIRGELKKAQEERDQVRAQMQGSMKALDAQRAEISRQAYARGKDDGGQETERANAALRDRIQTLLKQLTDAEERIREKARQLDEAERKVKAADGLAERAAKRAEEEARETIRKEYQGKLDFVNGERQKLEALSREQAAELEESQKAASQKWDEGYKAGMDRAEQAEKAVDEMRESLDGERKEWLAQMEEMRADLAAAEAREEKRAKELAELKRERAQAGMDAARGIRAEGTGALDLAAAVRAFIGAAGVLPQMGQTLAGMSTEERGAILAQVDTVARWVEGCRAALGVVAADGSVM